jgi:hypothetical protein
MKTYVGGAPFGQCCSGDSCHHEVDREER